MKNEKNEIEYYSLSKFFKINNDKLVNCWSILFIDNQQLNSHYFPYFLKNEKKILKNDIFLTTFQLYNEMLNKDKDIK